MRYAKARAARLAHPAGFALKSGLGVKVLVS